MKSNALNYNSASMSITRRRGSKEYEAMPSPLLNKRRSSIVVPRPAASDGKLHIELYNVAEKTIISNLGHSGSGYTIGIGTINKTIEIFQEHFGNKLYSNSALDIAIVGAGYIGLQTAIILKTKFPNLNITLYHKPPCDALEPTKNSASHAAAALLSVSGFNFEKLNSAEKAELGKYACETYKHFKPFIDKGELGNIIFYRKTYYGRSPDGEELDAGLQFYKQDEELKKYFEGDESTDIINFTLNSADEFQNKGLFTSYSKIIYIDSHALMANLRKQVRTLGVLIEEKTVKSFKGDLDQNIIFDCAAIAEIKDRKIGDKYVHIPSSTPDNKDSQCEGNIRIEPVLGHVNYYDLEGTKLDFSIIDEIRLLPEGKTDLENNYETHRIQIIPKNIYDHEGKKISKIMIGGTSLRREINQVKDEQESQLLEKIAKYYLGQEKVIEGYRVIQKKLSGTLSTIVESEENNKNRNDLSKSKENINHSENLPNNWQNHIISQKFNKKPAVLSKYPLSKSYDSFLSDLSKFSDTPGSYTSTLQSPHAIRSCRSF